MAKTVSMLAARNHHSLKIGTKKFAAEIQKLTFESTSLERTRNLSVEIQWSIDSENTLR